MRVCDADANQTLTKGSFAVTLPAGLDTLRLSGNRPA
jgi:hypothetical protein